MSIIAFRLERSGSTVCRKVVRNRDQGTGCYVPYRVGKLTATKSRRIKQPEMEDRVIPGHWKEDSIMGTASKNTISTLAERSSRTSPCRTSPTTKSLTKCRKS